MRHHFPLLPLALVACTDIGGLPPGAGPLVPGPDQDSCGATAQAELVGQDATALEKVLILGQVRVIRPGMPVTMDYRAERINFEIDGQGRIARIYCG